MVRVVLLVVALVLMAGCTASTVDQTLSPQPIAAQTNSQPQSATALVPETPSTQTQIASVASGTSLSFLPIEGAPAGAVQQLSKSIQRSANNHGLALRPSNDPSPQYRVKGYFSALNDGTGTLLTYIWDVVDANGKRLHRINGQERSGSRSTDPWQSITTAEIDRVADTTAASLKSWVDTRR